MTITMLIKSQRAEIVESAAGALVSASGREHHPAAVGMLVEPFVEFVSPRTLAALP